MTDGHKKGTETQSLGGNLTLWDRWLSGETDAGPKTTTNVVFDFLNQNKNPSEKHIYCEQTLQSDSCKCKLGRKPAKLGSGLKSKPDGLQKLTKQITQIS